MDNMARSGWLCMASYDREATKPNELSFQKGDTVFLVSDLLMDHKNYQATAANGDVGLFPANAIMQRSPIPMLPMPWFHSAISRLEAEKLLDRNQDGQFLLRESQHTKGVYALALSRQGIIKHYLVALDLKSHKLTVNGKKYFNNIPAMVEFYLHDTSDPDLILKHPVTRRGILEYFIDLEALKELWEIPDSELLYEDGNTSIGQGEFGEVHVASYRGMQVAVKSLQEKKACPTATESLVQEAAVITHLRHKNLVQLVGLVFIGSSVHSIVMELMGKGSLQKYLISRGRSVVSQAELLHFARDVCEGMIYISSQGFVHRDLAARNILLNSNGQAKISDFGLARRAEIHVPHEGGKFPVKWTAPEALKESKFSVKSDVWSFGVFLWEVYSYGRTPYPSIPSDEVLENLEDGIVMDPPDGCPDNIYDIMCHCWEMEPNERPDFPRLKDLLARTFGESRTSMDSPLSARKLVSLPNIEDLVTGSIAIKAYQEAPFQRKSTLFLANVVFLGPLGSGKTSLLRTFTGKTFRLIEPPSQQIAFSSSYHDLADWLPVVGGLVYEDELCRLIVEDLLKHVHSMLTSSAKLSSPGYGLVGGLGGRLGGGSMGSTFVGGASVGRDAPPPPLPPPRQRSRSYSDSHHNKIEDLSIEATKATNRLSASFEVIESGSPEGRLQLGVRPQPVADNKAVHPRRLHLSRQGRSFIDKLISPRLRRSFRVKTSSIRRHHSDSVHSTHLTVSDDHAIPTRKAANGSVPAASSYRSSCPLPEQLIEKIKKELQQSTDGTLNQKYYGRLIDMPGGGAFQVFKHLFITDSSICVLTFDISKDILSVPSPGPRRRSPLGTKDPIIRPSSENGQVNSSRQGHAQPGKASYLNQLLTMIGDICLQWSHSNSDLTVRGARIILVGTHSDKVPSSVSHRNFELLRKAIKGSPYEKYVSMVKFVVSSSSIIERSSIDDLKHFIMDSAKKACRVQVPLKWLRCVRRFQAFSSKKAYIMSMAEAKKIVAEVCDISQPEEIEGVIQFLHRNHIILCFERIHQLKEIVITDCKWFASHLSAVFKAGYIDLVQKGAPVELHSDQELLRLRGILTNQLLDYLWRDKETQKHKEELLTLMHKMDILCCMASETSPFSLSTSIEDLTLDSSAKKKNKSNVSAGVLSSVIIPSLVEESAPPHLASLPSFKAEPVIFRFKQGHVPSSLFQRLLVRCVQSYPNDYALYRDAATFEVDSVSLLVLTMGKDFIRVSLHRIRSGRESLSPTLDITDLDSLMSPNLRSPCPDVCMAILMFIQATISDLIQQWMPNLSYDLCVLCSCKSQVEKDIDVDHARKLSTMSEPGVNHSKVGDASATVALPAWNSNEDHYIVLSDMDNVLQHSFLRCEAGNQVPSSASLLCWFGEAPPIPSGRSTTSPVEDTDLVTDSDVDLVLRNLGPSWSTLGPFLGFKQREVDNFSLTSNSLADAAEKMLREWQTLNGHKATFFSLLTALEQAKRKDIADELIAVRMSGDGIAI